MPATSKQVTREYAKHTFPATATATAVFGFSCGVLAAVLNICSAAALEGDSSNIMVPISTNAAVSWVIASLFCVPFVLDKAFRRADYLNSCLAVIGWPIRRQVRMLAGQFAIILTGGTVLSYPVSVVTQWGLWRIRRANGVDMLFPQNVHAPISLTSLATATVLTALPLAVSFLAVLRSAAFGKIRENLDPTPVIITVPQPRLLSGQSLVFLIAIVCLWGAISAGDQAGIFVVLAFVLLLSWFAATWTLPLTRAVEKVLAKATPRSPRSAALSALLGEFHPSLRAVFVPLVYILGVPAVLFSVSRTEAIARHDPHAGVAVWDFSVLLGLALVYVGCACVVTFFIAAAEHNTTADYLNQVGIGELTTRALRFLGIPAMLLGASLAVAAVFAFLASLLHATLLGGTIVAAFQGLRLGFSCGLAAVLLVVFAVVGTCCVLRARN